MISTHINGQFAGNYTSIDKVPSDKEIASISKPENISNNGFYNGSEWIETETQEEIAEKENSKIAFFESYPELAGMNYQLLQLDNLPGIRRRETISNKGLKGRNHYEKNGVLIWSIETKYWFEADSNFPEGVVKIIKLYDKGERVIDTWVNEVEMSADRKQFVLLEQRQLIMIYFKSQQPTLFNFLYSFFKTEIDEYVQTGDKDKFESILLDAKDNHPLQDEEGNYIVRITLNSEVPTQSGGTTTVLNGILAELV